MIPVPSGVRVWIATGHTDMRRGMHGLALTVQERLKRDPHAGDLYIFRGRRGDLTKILWHDGIDFQVHLALGSADAVSISAAQMAYMLRDRLEKSTTDMATAERRMSQIKYWTTCILGRQKSLNL
jgi:transposase